jgi:hypothetical protein
MVNVFARTRRHVPDGRLNLIHLHLLDAWHCIALQIDDSVAGGRAAKMEDDWADSGRRIRRDWPQRARPFLLPQVALRGYDVPRVWWRHQTTSWQSDLPANLIQHRERNRLGHELCRHCGLVATPTLRPRPSARHVYDIGATALAAPRSRLRR